jgi:hypothetical protein
LCAGSEGPATGFPGGEFASRDSVILAARRSSCLSHTHKHRSRDRGGKLRYSPGHYRETPGYYLDVGCDVIYVPPRKVWVRGYYY